MVIVKGLGNHELPGFRGSQPSVKPSGLHSGAVAGIIGVRWCGGGGDWGEDSLDGY